LEYDPSLPNVEHLAGAEYSDFLRNRKINSWAEAIFFCRLCLGGQTHPVFSISLLYLICLIVVLSMHLSLFVFMFSSAHFLCALAICSWFFLSMKFYYLSKLCIFLFSWRILKCSPANPSLLGLNIGGGAEVKLRLRRPNREWDFFPYEQILDTMLHELCHNEYGPHNTDFYNLLDEIRKVIVLFPVHAKDNTIVYITIFGNCFELGDLWP